jgi:hypothetical protein
MSRRLKNIFRPTSFMFDHRMENRQRLSHTTMFKSCPETVEGFKGFSFKRKAIRWAVPRFGNSKLAARLKSSEAFTARSLRSKPSRFNGLHLPNNFRSGIGALTCLSRAPAKFRESFRPQLPLKKSKASHSSGFAPSVDDFGCKRRQNTYHDKNVGNLTLSAG